MAGKTNVNQAPKHGDDSSALLDELVPLCNSWTSPCWDEIDYLSRIKEVQLREVLEIRKKELSIIRTTECLQCPSFVKHVRIGAYVNICCLLMHISLPCVMMSG